MSFEKIEDYLKKTEAQQNYDTILQENIQLRNTLKQERKEHTEEKNKLEATLRELHVLRIKFQKDEYSLRSFNTLVGNAVKKETEEWKKKELQKNLQEKWSQEAAKLTEQRLREEIKAYPRCSPELKENIEKKANQEVNEILKNRLRWPSWFKKLYHNEVERLVKLRQNNEFHRRVQDEAEYRLHELVDVEWPKYLERQITPFCQASAISQLQQLSRPWTLHCDKCGAGMQVSLTPYQIADLINRPFITIKCINPKCKEYLRRHLIKLSLGNVIQRIIEENPPIYIGIPVKEDNNAKN